MRHHNKINSLGRSPSHRRSMFQQLSISLIVHKRMFTTLAKAKALRPYIEPLITRSKEDSTHSRRHVFSHLRDKAAVNELFGVIAEKVSERPGGYTRIVKLPPRMGDGAAYCMIELLDFNTRGTLSAEEKKTGRSRRKRRRSGEKDASTEVKEVSGETSREKKSDTT